MVLERRPAKTGPRGVFRKADLTARRKKYNPHTTGSDGGVWTYR